jgi:formylglycine-generating enzyme required for sulfatase activity
MVRVERPSGGAFCIDAYEVSVGEYRAFVANAAADTAGAHSPVCEWNKSLAPATDLNGCDQYDFGTAPSDRPVVCIDWCDALAYCTAVGKRLCGPLDPAKPTNPFGQGDHEASEWYVACSARGTKSYPYGSTFDASACVTQGVAPQSARAATCEGGYAGIHHLSGNVAEWDNSCDQGADPRADGCRARGGAFWIGNSPVEPEKGRCDASQGGRRDQALNDRGFRCCK